MATADTQARKAYDARMEKEHHKILVVDDDARLRSLLDRYLAEQGFSVKTVPDAAQMDRALTREHYALMVLDLMLPGEDGLSICKRLRASDNKLPIVVFDMTETGNIERAVLKPGEIGTIVGHGETALA